jgi:hypothetical protein
MLSSGAARAVPGVVFQDQGGGRGLLTWLVPATFSLGRCVLTVRAADDGCPVNGVTYQTLPFLVTQLATAARPRQQLTQAPYPAPFSEEVRFALHEKGSQAVLVVDELGRTVAQLTSSPDGNVVWRPASGTPAGLYLARTQSGSQVARLAYTGQ